MIPKGCHLHSDYMSYGDYRYMYRYVVDLKLESTYVEHDVQATDRMKPAYSLIIQSTISKHCYLDLSFLNIISLAQFL